MTRFHGRTGVCLLNPNSPRTVLHITRSGGIWLGVSGFLTALAWYKAINLLLLLGYFLLALVIVNIVVAWRMVGRVRGHRRSSVPVFARESVLRIVEVENPTNRSVAVLISDAGGDVPARWLVGGLKPNQHELLRAQATFATRGQHPVGPLLVESGFPFGFAVWSARLEPAVTISVLPAIGYIDVDGLRRFLARAAGGEGRSRRPSRRPTPGTGDVRGVRPYRVGDSPRDVHWRTTARRGQLFVREYDQTDPLNLVVVLDPWMPHGIPSLAAVAGLEWACSLVASICSAWANADEPGEVSLILPDSDPIRLFGASATVSFREALAPLAGLRGRSEVAAIPASAVRANVPRTSRLVVSSRADSPLLSGLRRAGVSIAGVDPSSPVPWYHTPG